MRVVNFLRRVVLFAIAAAALIILGNDSHGAQASTTSTIISNGTVQLGVWDTGNLNAPGGTASCGTGTTIVGLRFVPTNCDSTSPGCTCEGWGAADAVSNTSGYANDHYGGSFNMIVESFTYDASSAVSTVMLANGLRVTHDYHPSLVTPNLYEVVVTIENASAAEVHLLYRRVMDWDIEPTPFNEFVTLNPGTASDLVFTSNNGFAPSDPLAGPSDIGFTGAFVDAGPDDHGALFDFDFGTLPVGASKTFVTFYGAAPTEVDAVAALAAVGAEAYSLGQTSLPDGPALGAPNTFIFAFAGDVAPSYLAISDSYGTGCSIESNPAGDPICQKAVTSYPQILRTYWDQDSYPGLRLVELTRWGETALYFAEGDGRSSIETAVLRKPKVVTITLGANDFEFADFRHWLIDTPPGVERYLHAHAHAVRLRLHLRSILTLIRTISPDSVVFVTGYPTPPTAGKCRGAREYWDMLSYNTNKLDGLNDAAQAAASEFPNTYFVRLDTREFEKHTMASKSSWYFGTKCDLSLTTAVSCIFNQSLCDPHPNQTGAKAIADIIRASAAGRLP